MQFMEYCLSRSQLSSKPWFPQQSSNEEISTIAKELNNAKAPNILYDQFVFIINITLLCAQLTMEGMTIILDGLRGVPKKVT